MFDPVSTYRIQFHNGFNFRNFMEIIPYLHELGVVTIYASPIFEAVPGSMHGYDVIDPHRINPEIGTLQELETISMKLKELGMNWLQDIVPNHMAFDPGNDRLMDVLEKGQASPYAGFFDISWDAPGFDGKLMVPFLGKPLDDTIADGEIKVAYQDEKFTLNYAGQAYPLNEASITTILESWGDAPAAESIRHNINKNLGLIRQLIDAQYYRLCFWQDTDQQINYRRFFTVNGLICLNIQEEKVFDEYHSFLKELLDKGLVQGLRVDHIDGLFDPQTYLERLRKLADKETYIVVEKILEQDEQFPADWPVQGNTGYDFLGMVNNLLTEDNSKKAFTDFYRELAADRKSLSRSITEKKSDILYGHMAGELENLYQLFRNIPTTSRNIKDITDADWKLTIGGFLIHCPVYRYYGNQLPLNAGEAEQVRTIFRKVISANPELEQPALYVVDLFTGKHPQKMQAGILLLYQRCMQFTGPLMAKGVEDTLMYTYDRFIGHNEVGDSPQEFGLGIQKFHSLMRERQKSWPLSLNGTSTHDTKRGEDVRARLNVLTDIPEQWFKQVRSWQNQNRPYKTGNAPDANDEYLIYQTITGFITDNEETGDQISSRLEAYLTKALREAKLHTGWAEPDEQYEQSTLQFAQKLLNSAVFLKSMKQLQEDISPAFINNSIAQVLLKFTCPGVPDVYQGCERWDFSLVDPDNRRPVDYKRSAALLKKSKNLKPEELWHDRANGSFKLWLTHKLLTERKYSPLLFSHGEYIPLTVEGAYQDHMIAFARKYQRQWVLVVAALHTAAFENGTINWKDTKIILPPDAPLQWTRALDDKKTILNEQLLLSDHMAAFPVLLFKSAPPPENRGAGIIMHISSLPSPYSIGDLGPEARRFARFLGASNQRYWQLLPVNPTVAAAANSPYSAISGMAGNTLLISPDDLLSDGLLTEEEISRYRRASSNTANYNRAATIKDQLLDAAYVRFGRFASDALQTAYEDFKIREQLWLNHFALFEAIKQHHDGAPWYLWPEDLKFRDRKALETFRHQHQQDIGKSMWRQFIFFRQWRKLKSFVREQGLHMIGDLPFYLSYDAVDVWAHPELFSLDKEKNLSGIAGVPPDYFNADGQLWNMPVYNWAVHDRTGYEWWIARIKKNMEFYDLIRMDHFRGLSEFWEVPAGKKNAVHGQWKPGPGAGIFQAFKKAFGHLPFIAEDLGDIDERVYELRDQFNLPGMNVLQYAFGEDMSVSVHALHNHRQNSITYTGTHDNNTLFGWYKEDMTMEERRNLAIYFRTKITRGNLKQLLLETCYASVSAIAMVPMQDVLGLGQHSRMNTPASRKDNWRWRMDASALTDTLAASLSFLVRRFNR